jgi:hypothetical protein
MDERAAISGPQRAIRWLRTVEITQDRLVAIAVAVIGLCVMIQSTQANLEIYALRQHISALESRLDAIHENTPNGCEHKFDGVDYYYVCTP